MNNPRILNKFNAPILMISEFTHIISLPNIVPSVVSLIISLISQLQVKILIFFSKFRLWFLYLLYFYKTRLQIKIISNNTFYLYKKKEENNQKSKSSTHNDAWLVPSLHEMI